MSVGHVARLLEKAGIPTIMIGIRSAWVRIAQMMLPRIVVVPHFMGRTLGAPDDHAGHRAVILKALNLLESAKQGGTMVEFPGLFPPVPKKDMVD